MELNLLPVINADGKKIDFNAELDFSINNEQGVIFLSPVKVSGELMNVGGSIEFSALAQASVRYSCDRCCKEYDDFLKLEIKEVLKEDVIDELGEKNPDAIYFTGNSVSLDEIVRENVFLNLPFKRLCKADCKGLCAKCGADLNEGECGCDTREVDPRFADLDKFFK